MTTKKLGVAIALASIMALGLAACGPSTETTSTTTETTTVTEAPAMESVMPSVMPSTTP